jgi:hypothetical protein
MRTLEERFWPKVTIGRAFECWEWSGALNKQGYGSFWAGAARGAHRIAYELMRGAVPEGAHLDHLCRNRACVNPWHLEPVSQRVNVLRGVGATATNARKTHCRYGHAFTTENTRTYRGGRKCRTCGRLHDAVRSAERSERRKVARLEKIAA